MFVHTLGVAYFRRRKGTEPWTHMSLRLRAARAKETDVDILKQMQHTSLGVCI